MRLLKLSFLLLLLTAFAALLSEGLPASRAQKSGSFEKTVRRSLLGRQGWLQLVQLGLDDYHSELYLSANS